MSVECWASFLALFLLENSNNSSRQQSLFSLSDGSEPFPLLVIDFCFSPKELFSLVCTRIGFGWLVAVAALSLISLMASKDMAVMIHFDDLVLSAAWFSTVIWQRGIRRRRRRRRKGSSSH